MSGTLFALLCTATLMNAGAQDSGTGGVGRRSMFQIRLVADRASANTQEMPMKSPDGPTVTLEIEKKPLMDLASVASAKVVKDDGSGQAQLHIVLTGEGRERLAEVTRRNIHRRIAVIIDGTVYAAPVIQAEISSEFIPVHTFFTDKQAEELARKVNDAVHEGSPGRQ